MLDELIAAMERLFCGTMGVRKIYRGETKLYERKSSYVYIELYNTEG